MVIECPSLDSCHRENKGLMAHLLLLHLQFGKIKSGETGIEMEVELVALARLAITQPGELLGIAKQEFDLKAQFVEAVDLVSALRQVG